MKTTVAKMKKKIQKAVANKGTSLHRNNPFWMNKAHIEYMREALDTLVFNGFNFPDRHYTPTNRQAQSLSNWIDGLRDRYLFNR